MFHEAAPHTLQLRLRPPQPGDEGPARKAQTVMEREEFNFGFLRAQETWSRYLARLAQERAGHGLLPDRVPGVFLYATVGQEIIGRSSIRFALNELLLARGGHIGFAVLPEFRRRGYATQILHQSLVIARAEGIDAVLVTCDDDNIGSITVIERCGGRLDPDWPTYRSSEPGDVLSRRYWIA